VSLVNSATRDGDPVGDIEPGDTLLSPLDQTLISRLQAVALQYPDKLDQESSILKTDLLAVSPLSDAVLEKAIDLGVLNGSDLKDVLLANSPASTDTLLGTIDSKRLASSELKTVLDANSPLPAEVLAKVIDGSAGLSVADRQSVLDAQIAMP
jgi:hypothetical protein